MRHSKEKLINFNKKAEKQNPENARVRIENMTPEHIKDTEEQVRQRNEINTKSMKQRNHYEKMKCYGRRNYRA